MTREEAIRIIEQSDYFWIRPTPEEHEALNMAIEALKAQEWTPCSEGLPKEWEHVLVTEKNNKIRVLKMMDKFNDWADEKDELYCSSGYVKAWMPLPEPYKA